MFIVTSAERFNQLMQTCFSKVYISVIYDEKTQVFNPYKYFAWKCVYKKIYKH